MAIELSAFNDLLPIFSFLLIFISVFAIFAKTKILGENKWVQLFISFVIASVFITTSGAREFVIKMTPWFAVFVVLLIFILALIGFSGKVAFLEKGIGVIFVVGLLVLFLVSAYMSFGDISNFVKFKNWLFSPRIYGALFLIIISAVVSWVLVKSK
ncbi:MAG: hypothetical protein N3D20_01475 [Candidatus Pacearchaeota archaeon]|nr:hypothetical protein [Candidatus Pacearchaeota archaeon]